MSCSRTRRWARCLAPCAPGRPMLTADLTRIGPPALAAAAAECGLVSSLALPIEYDGERLGALQLLGERQAARRGGRRRDPATAPRRPRGPARRRAGAGCRSPPAATQAVTGSADAVAAESAGGPGRREHVRGHHPVAAGRHAADGPAASPSSSSTTPRSFAPPLVPPQTRTLVTDRPTERLPKRDRSPRGNDRSAPFRAAHP